MFITFESFKTDLFQVKARSESEISKNQETIQSIFLGILAGLWANLEPRRLRCVCSPFFGES